MSHIFHYYRGFFALLCRLINFYTLSAFITSWGKKLSDERLFYLFEKFVNHRFEMTVCWEDEYL